MEKPIFDSRDIGYKRPFGAVPAGQTVHYSIRWQSDAPVSLVVLRDDTKREVRKEMQPGQREDEWEASFVFREKGLYFYRFEGGGRYVCRTAPDSCGYLTDRPDGAWFIQTVYDAAYRPPAPYAGRVIYQIFPDRFYRDTVIRTEFTDRYIHENLSDMPFFRPVNGVVRNNDFFGGNLLGITEKLPYLRELGIGAIYLNPIFESHSNHRYDTADYRKVDPLLGTNEHFVILCEAAKRNGMLVILDGVFSHTGADSVYFNKEKRYGEGGAYNDPKSPYRSWYKFDGSPAGYHSWWGFDTLPEVNESDPGFRSYICGEGGVIDCWLSMGAGGFRLDVADELPDDFIADIRKAVKRNGEDKILIGEVWEDASTKEAYGARRRYLWGDELDSVMNYPFREAIIDFVRDADAALFMRRVMEIVENYPKPMMDVMMNLLSTHDTDRLITALSKMHDTVDREWQARQTLTRDAYLRGIEMAKLAFALLMTLPGLPTVYYGDEAGMQGYRDPFNRGFFPWSHIDKNLRDHVARLAERRNGCGAFADGEMIPVYAEGGCVAFLRENADSRVFVMVNRSDAERRVHLDRRTFVAAGWETVIEDLS